MFDQGMGDSYNHNYSCEPSAFGQWWNSGYWEPWYTPYPYCHWHYGFNNYGEERYARDHHHIAHFANMAASNGASMEYKQHLREHNSKHENGRTTNSAWNSVKIDSFATQTQSESFKSNSKCCLRKSTIRRKSRKSKLGPTSQSKTSLENLLGKLGTKICASGCTLACILIQPEKNKNTDENCSDSTDALQFEVKNQFLDELNRQLNDAELLDTSVPANKKSIRNLKKLCTDMGECLKYGVKPTKVHSSTEKLGQKSARSCKISEPKAKTTKCDKNLLKRKKTFRREEPTIGEIAPSKKKQLSRERETRKTSKLSRSQQRSYLEKSWREKLPIKKRRLWKENQSSNVTPTIAPLQKRVKAEMLPYKFEPKRVSAKRKPRRHKSCILTTGSTSGCGEYHITWRV